MPIITEAFKLRVNINFIKFFEVKINEGGVKIFKLK